MLPGRYDSMVPNAASAARTLRSAPERYRSAIWLVDAAGPFLREVVERVRRAGRVGVVMICGFGGL